MFDSPNTNDEIIRDSQSRTAKDSKQAIEWYDLHKKAETSGGTCRVCGWKDGDGVKACFYYSDLGAVTHENSDASARKTMSARQIALMDSYETESSSVYSADDEQRRRTILRPLTAHHAHGCESIKKPHWHINNMIMSNDYADAEAVITSWLRSSGIVNKPKPTLEEALATGCVIRHKTTRKHTDGIFRGLTLTEYHVQKPHDCGGFATYKGPYHIGCTGCNTEVRLWEHGIDYDIG